MNATDCACASEPHSRKARHETRHEEAPRRGGRWSPAFSIARPLHLWPVLRPCVLRIVNGNAPSSAQRPEHKAQFPTVPVSKRGPRLRGPRSESLQIACIHLARIGGLRLGEGKPLIPANQLSELRIRQRCGHEAESHGLRHELGQPRNVGRVDVGLGQEFVP